MRKVAGASARPLRRQGPADCRIAPDSDDMAWPKSLSSPGTDDPWQSVANRLDRAARPPAGRGHIAICQRKSRSGGSRSGRGFSNREIAIYEESIMRVETPAPAVQSGTADFRPRGRRPQSLSCDRHAMETAQLRRQMWPAGRHRKPTQGNASTGQTDHQ